MKNALAILFAFLFSASASLAQVGQAVMTTGNQTISGEKTFSGDLKFTGPAAVVYSLDQDSASSLRITTGTITLSLEQDGDLVVPGGLFLHKNGDGDTSRYFISGVPTGSRIITLPDASVTFGAFSPTLLNVADEAAFKAAVNLETGTDVLPVVEAPVAIAASEIDWTDGRIFTKTLSANTTFTFANAASGMSIVVAVTNTADDYTAAWPAVQWQDGAEPAMSPDAVTDLYFFMQIGSTIYGSYSPNHSAP